MSSRFDTWETTEQFTARSAPPSEGVTTKATESITARVPSGTYLSAAIASMVVSAGLQFTGRPHLSLFVGQWAPSILIMGLYNKLVKVAGSD